MGIFDYVSPMGMKHFKNINGRKEYFKLGGIFCKYLACGWNPVIKIGDFIFCHGGINPKIANKYTIHNINLIMRDTLYGNEFHINQPYFNELFLDPDSILWNRDYSVDVTKAKENRELNSLQTILIKYNAKYIVIGNTPQTNGIGVRFNGHVFCVDTGMSEAFGKKKMDKSERIHFLEILNNKNEVLVH